MVAKANPKAIGMPDSTAVPSSSTKNTSKFQLPMACSGGAVSHKAAAKASSTAAPSSTARSRKRVSCIRADRPISARPTGIAKARTRPDQPSAGVST